MTGICAKGLQACAHERKNQARCARVPRHSGGRSSSLQRQVLRFLSDGLIAFLFHILLFVAPFVSQQSVSLIQLTSSYRSLSFFTSLASCPLPYHWTDRIYSISQYEWYPKWMGNNGQAATRTVSRRQNLSWRVQSNPLRRRVRPC